MAGGRGNHVPGTRAGRYAHLVGSSGTDDPRILFSLGGDHDHAGELGELGAMEVVQTGMYRKLQNKYGVDMVMKVEEAVTEKTMSIRKMRTDPYEVRNCINFLDDPE